MFLLVALLPVIGVLAAPQTAKPIVIWHGMGGTSSSPRLGRIMKIISEKLPGVYIKPLKIGDSFYEEVKNGFLMNANQQVEMACQQIASDTTLQNGYNAIGISQGAQFLRAVAQRCPTPRMINFISLGGQHQGIYGLPHCTRQSWQKWCNYLRIILNKGVYWKWVQNLLVQAEYWHDPLNEDKYKERSVFIGEINNEKYINESYRENLKKLEHMVLVKFENDTMVVPIDSGWFGFYTPGQSVSITNLEESPLYTEDRLGLKELKESNRLHLIALPGGHIKFSQEWLEDEIIGKYLS